MRRKLCKRCGTVFDAKTPYTIICPDCKKSDTPVNLSTHICKQCGAAFIGGHRASYCPNCRRIRAAERDRLYKRNGPARQLGSIDYCLACGAEYVVEGSLQKYCKSCAKQATANAYRDRRNQMQRAYTQSLPPGSRKAMKVCTVCGKPFQSNTPTVTCSEACAKELRRLRYNESLIRQGHRKLPADAHYDSGLPKSGVPGVTFHRNTKKWEVRYKGQYYGQYANLEDAITRISTIKTIKEEEKHDK